MITSTIEALIGNASTTLVAKRTRLSIRAGGRREIMTVEEGLVGTAMTVTTTAELRTANVRIGGDIVTVLIANVAATDLKSEILAEENLGAEVNPHHSGGIMTITTTDHAEEDIPYPQLPQLNLTIPQPTPPQTSPPLPLPPPPPTP